MVEIKAIWDIVYSEFYITNNCLHARKTSLFFLFKEKNPSILLVHVVQHVREKVMDHGRFICQGITMRNSEKKGILKFISTLTSGSERGSET